MKKTACGLSGQNGQTALKLAAVELKHLTEQYYNLQNMEERNVEGKDLGTKPVTEISVQVYSLIAIIE